MLLATLHNVTVIVRWSHGALGLTGWGEFWLTLFLVAVWS